MRSHTIRAAALLGVALTVGVGAATAGATESPEKPSTNEHLLTAMHGEAFANAKYLAYSQVARQSGRPALATLFRNTAAVELGQHFTEEARLAGLAGSDAQNLRDAIKGESYEAATMYPAFARQAKAQGNGTVAARLLEIGTDEAAHRDSFKAALGSLTGTGKVPVGPAAQPVQVEGSGSRASGRTKANLDAAMHGESFAYAKYMLYAAHARSTGHQAIARLFERTAQVELTQHFREEGNLAGLARGNRDNLRNAIAGENHETRSMYPEYARAATSAGDAEAGQRFREIGSDEATHRDAYKAALRSLAS